MNVQSGGQPDESIEITSRSPEETKLLGEIIGQSIDQKTTISLSGDLGAGKTVFVQGLAKGLTCLPITPSPAQRIPSSTNIRDD